MGYIKLRALADVYSDEWQTFDISKSQLMHRKPLNTKLEQMHPISNISSWSVWRHKRASCVSQQSISPRNKARLLTFPCVYLWFPRIQTRLSVRSNLQTSITSPSWERRKRQNPKASWEQRQIRRTLSSRIGFLTDCTINKGYERVYENGERKGGKHGPVYLCHVLRRAPGSG